VDAFPSPLWEREQGEGEVVTKETFQKRKAQTGHRKNARRLRSAQSDTERRFWSIVRGRRFVGYKFKRQYPVGPYIADFVCLTARLIVELDGGQHAEQQDYDEMRTRFLEAEGFRVIRFWNVDLKTNLRGTIELLLRALEIGDTSPSPTARELASLANASLPSPPMGAREE